MRKSSRLPDGKVVAVLGGCGFIGSRLCHMLLATGYRVRVLKKVSSRTDRIAGIMDCLEIVVADQTHADEVIDALKGVDVVIHLIHTTLPGSSMQNPAFDVTSNVASTAAWLSRLRETCVRRVIYISSGGTVYGVPRSLPVLEDHPLSPISTYGISKLACERFTAMFSELNGIEFRILRPSNAYGEGQPINRGQGLLGVMVDRISRGEAVEVWGTGRGLRDYVHVDDVVEAILASIEHVGASRIFNVSTGVGHSALSLINLFQSRIGCKVRVEHLAGRGFDVPDNVLDNTLLRSETTWYPRVSLEEGIDRILNLNKRMRHPKVGAPNVCA